MQVTDLLVEVRDGNLNRVGQIPVDYLVGFTVVRRFNGIGTWSLSLPLGHPMEVLLKQPGAGVVVTVRGTVLMSGFTTWIQTIQTAADPDGVTQITGLDDSVLLRDRLAYPTPATADVTLQTTPYDVRTGTAEDVIKGYVSDNMGPTAPAARKVAALTIETSSSRGATVKGSARFDGLYDLVKGLADASTNSGSTMGFNVVQSGNTLQFKVYQPTDRSGYVRMDIANNKLLETTYSLAQPKTTRAIVGGSGDAAARTFLERSSYTSLQAETSWTRRIETFVDSRDTSDATALATSGDSVLANDGKAQITASVRPSDDQTMLFGQHYYLGDTVTVVVGSYELAAVVTEVGISVAVDGVRLNCTVGEPKLQDYESQILAKQVAMASRLNTLERYK
jgi:hypothetical protein